ncbi:SPOR domain-containing protein [Magnetococcus sp. PR-3]|uniref:SPOR domain-containing protein n=1 Tax=Magnetococcus sp. PR-3 TaxID=3120355 RepID=UPI002FCE45CC
MNPRYPASRRYRRHQSSVPKPAVLLMAGVCVLVAGWLVWPKAETSVESPQAQVAEPVQQPETKQVPPVEPAVVEAEDDVVRTVQTPAELKVETAKEPEPVEEVDAEPAPLPSPAPAKRDPNAKRVLVSVSEEDVEPGKRDVEFQFYKGLIEHRVVLPGDQGQKGMRTALSKRPANHAVPDFSAIQSAVLKTVAAKRPVDKKSQKSKFKPRSEAQNRTAEAWSPAKSIRYARNLQAMAMGARQGPSAAVQGYLKRHDEAAQRKVSPRISTPVMSRSGMFAVQVAAFNRYEQAQKLLGRLMRQGEQARILPGKINGAPVYRVRVGPFRTRTDANNTARRWQVKGLSAMVTRHVPG